MTTRADRQRAYARDRARTTLQHRREQLDRLRDALVAHREPLLAALKADLCKPEVEAYAAEFGPVMHEIAYAKRHLRRWMKDRRVGPGRWIESSPLGAALVIGTWNYPVQLTLMPVVDAIAAGNGITIKPSEVAPATADALATMIRESFDPDAVDVVTGGPEVANELIDTGYDTVFFTGSPRVGALVAERAAKHHSRVTLELGGKSPLIVGPRSDPIYTARRIAWGKFINAGQTCMAPDYLVVPEADVDRLMDELVAAIQAFYGNDPEQSPDYARIASTGHTRRLADLAKRAGLAPRVDEAARYIAPTIARVEPDSPLMEEEIFGPILPVLTYRSMEELRAVTERHTNPLAVYVFSRDRRFVRDVLEAVPSGGAMINDVVLHTVDSRLPFGGRRSSGVGAYHGRFGYEAFSHIRGVARVRQLFRNSPRFPPYRELPERLRRMVFGL